MSVSLIDEPTWVYFAYCSHNGLLYVGVASDVKRRITQHRRDKAWWDSDVDQVLCELFPTRRQALDVEAHAIFTMRPLHNRKGAAPAECQPHEVPPHSLTTLRFVDQRGEAV